MERATKVSSWKISSHKPSQRHRQSQLYGRHAYPKPAQPADYHPPEERRDHVLAYPIVEQQSGYRFLFGPHPDGLVKYSFEHGSPNKFVWCGVCQFRFGKKIFHRHYSTEYFHLNNSSKGEVLCPSCKVWHPTESTGKHIILFTSSTLHDVIYNQAVCLDFHIDVESIPGAQLIDLWKNWQQAYGKLTTVQTVIVVGGLNDVAKKTPTAIINIIKAWQHEVVSLNGNNSFFVTKLMRPPKLAWFPKNGQAPSTSYVNHLDKINEINLLIDQFNNELYSFPVVGFQTEGCRSGGSRRALDGTIISSKTSHNLKAWRELDQGPEFCLHLTEPHRISMFRRLCGFILHRIIRGPSNPLLQ